MSVFVKIYQFNPNLVRPLFTFHKAGEHINKLGKKYKTQMLDGKACIMVEFESDADSIIFKLTWGFDEYIYQ